MSVRVVARVRPLLKTEIQRDSIVTTHAADSENPEAKQTIVKIPNPKNFAESFSYHFNGVYDSQVSQQDFFDAESQSSSYDTRELVDPNDETVAPTVKHLYNGYDVTIFAYGVTGTGKTHTMRGGKTLADRGVIPRLLSSIYRRGRKVEKETENALSIRVSMSYYEIYCDKVFDLFEPPEQRSPSGLPIRDNHGKTVVVGLTERPCASLKEFEQLYDQANVNRSTFATKLNAHSSRSHAVLTVKVTQTSGDQEMISTASAIDLAGSEDNRRTDNDRERLVESSSINKSLFVLAQCVEAIQRGQKRIPYRESKMTRILSLGNQNGITVMILNLAPLRSYHLDTVQSLSFASRAKKIEVREVENEPTWKGPPRLQPQLTARREPLKNLSNATNVDLSNVTVDIGSLSKPVKSFSIYRTSGSRESLLKRPLSVSSLQSTSRPTKASKPDDDLLLPAEQCSRPNSVTLQPLVAQTDHVGVDVEKIVERMIEEKLARRQESDRTVAVPSINNELQRRLDALESRIDSDISRTQVLSFDTSLHHTTPAIPAARSKKPVHKRLSSIPTFNKRSSMYVPPTDDRSAEQHSEQAFFDVYRDQLHQQETIEEEPLTPRSRKVLDIVNTRDVAQISYLLKAIDPRRAETIATSLCEAGQITDLEQLGSVRGVGVRAVMTMRDALLS